MNKRTDLLCRISDVLSNFTFTIQHIRIQNTDMALKTFRGALGDLQNILSPMLMLTGALHDEEGELLKQSFMEGLKTVSEAQDEEDYILMADYLEIKVIPLLQRMIEIARAEIPDDDSTLWSYRYELNRQFLSEKLGEGAEIIGEERYFEYEKINQIFEEENYDVVGYEIETTGAGWPTIKIKREGYSYYLHSNVNPTCEGRNYISQFVDGSRMEYNIFGLGLAHHVTQLAFINNGARINVYEHDRKMILQCLKIVSLQWLEQYNIHVYADEDFKMVMEAMKRDINGVIIHFPSLRNIQNPLIHRKFMEYYIQGVSYRGQLNNMLSNFEFNRRNIEHSVDELRNVFVGKDVYIVAAGPSLDKNIITLKLRKRDSIVLATGTCLRKLLSDDINVDYAIALDAKEIIYWQFFELEGKHVPVILASTACQRITREYEAEKYIACQCGFEPAENLAKERNYSLFHSGGSVSTIAMDIAIGLGAKRVIFLGLDLAFTNNMAHASGTASQLATSQDKLFPVKDFYETGVVYSDVKFEIYRKWFSRRIKELRNAGVTVPIINATEGGSFINGMEHRTLQSCLNLS